MSLVLRSVYNFYECLFNEYKGKIRLTQIIVRFFLRIYFECDKCVCLLSIPNSDPRLESYPMTGSPFPILGLIVIYVLFVTDWGPNLMKNRPAYDLKNVIKIYNLLQIIVNLLIGLYVSFRNFSVQKNENIRRIVHIW